MAINPSGTTAYNYPGIWGGAQPKQGPVNTISKGYKADLATGGNLYTVLTETLNASQGSVQNVVIRTPPYSTSNKFVYLNFRADCDSKARVAFYEGPTVSVSGTDLTQQSLNRAIKNSIPNLNFYASNTVTASGTLLGLQHIGTSGSGPGQGTTAGAGSSQMMGEFFVLSASAYYLAQVIVQGVASDVDMIFDYYLDTIYI